MQLRKQLNEQLKKVQALPDKTKRTMIIVAGLGMSLFWANSLVKTVKSFSPEAAIKDLNLQDMSSKAGQAMEIEGEMKKKMEQLQL